MTNNEFFFFNGTQGDFSPLSVSGLVTWINASSVQTSGANITQMNDLSGNNNHAVQHTGANRPTLVAGVLNGLPVARFTSGHHFTFINNGTFTAGMTSIVVLKINSSATLNTLFTKTITNAPRPFDAYATSATTQFEFALGSNRQNTPLGTSLYRILTLSHDTITGKYYINGVPDGITTGGYNVLDTGTLMLGTRDDEVTQLLGDVAEAMLWNRQLSDAEIIQISNWLKQKYNI